MADVLVLVDWENIHYTLERAYNLHVPPQACIEQIAVKARSYGTTHLDVFYNAGLTNRDLGLAIRACEAYGQPLYPANLNEPEKNLADTYIATEAMCRFFKEKPSLVIIVSGDNGYTPVLRAIRDNGGKAIIFSLKKALANIIKTSLVGEGLALLDDLILPHGRPIEELSPKSSGSGRHFTPRKILGKSLSHSDKASPSTAVAAARQKDAKKPIPEDSLDIPIITVVLSLIEKLAEAYGDFIEGDQSTPNSVSLSNEMGKQSLGALHDGIARGFICVSEPTYGSEASYRPNYENAIVREILLTWVAFAARLREITPPNEKQLQSLVDQISPPLVNDDVRSEFYFPSRNLVRSLGQAARDVGAIESRQDGIKMWVKPILQSSLMRVPIKFSVPFNELPEKLQNNLQTLARTQQVNDPAAPERGVVDRAMEKTVSKPMRTIRDIAIALDRVHFAKLEASNDRATAAGT